VSAFPPQTLRQYALLADGERGAVIGPHGEIAFLCLPRWDDDAVFASLIGGKGHYAVTPSAARYVWGGHYEDGTLVWRSRWVSTTAEIECREALAMPADPKTAVILRRVEALADDAHVRVVIDPHPGFGQHSLSWRCVSPGTWEGSAGGLYFRWSGAPERTRHRHGSLIEGEISLPEGGRHTMVLEASTEPLGALPDADRLWRQTEACWKDRPRLAESVGAGDVRRAYAVLRGMTSMDGGMVAAATMSLPERSEAGRNYDYRYAWVRDQCYAGVAAATAEAWPLLDSAADFVAAHLLDDGPDLKPAYTVTGGRVPDEQPLGLDGYPGGADKIGNRVNEQFQLDALGECLLLFAAASRADRVDSHHVKAAHAAVDAIERRRHEADSGIWELDPKRWAESRLICAAGLRQYARGEDGSPAQWTQLADDLVSEVRQECVHSSGRWQRAPDDPRLDASLLLPAVRGALPADDPVSVATWHAVDRELSDDGYVYRFRHDDRPLDEAEGAFVLCGFHMALACHQQGDDISAFRYFERNRSALGPPGLFTEEFDVVQRQLRGNFPQSFVHALLMESAVTLAAADATTRLRKEAS
jgi:hypothetical protein